MDKLLTSMFEHLGIFWGIVVVLWVFLNFAATIFLLEEVIQWLCSLEDGVKVGHLVILVIFPITILLAIFVTVLYVVVRLLRKVMNVQIVSFNKEKSSHDPVTK